MTFIQILLFVVVSVNLFLSYARMVTVTGPVNDEKVRLVVASFQDELNSLLTSRSVESTDHLSPYENLIKSISDSSIFWSSIWELIPIKISSKFHVMYTLEDVKRIFTERHLKVGPSNIQVVDEHVGIGKLHSFMADSGLAQGNLVKDQNHWQYVLEKVSKVGTVVIDSAETVDPILANVSRVFASSFGIPFVGINMYTTKLGQDVAAPLHTDKMDSFIVQAQGRKLWRVFAPHPSLSHPLEDLEMPDRGKNGDILFVEDAGPLLLDVSLDQGDMLYLPRGLPHATSTHKAMMPAGVNLDTDVTGSYKGKNAKPFSTKKQKKRRNTNTKIDEQETGASSLPVSLSLTVSLLSGSVGLTYDKMLRCSAVQFLCLPTENVKYCKARLSAVAMAQRLSRLRRSLFLRPMKCAGSLPHVASSSPAAKRNHTCSPENASAGDRSSSCGSIGFEKRQGLGDMACSENKNWVDDIYAAILDALLDVVTEVSAAHEGYRENLMDHLQELEWEHFVEMSLFSSSRGGDGPGKSNHVSGLGVTGRMMSDMNISWLQECGEHEHCSRIHSKCTTLLRAPDICCKIEYLVRNLVAQVYINTCNARDVHLHATGWGLSEDSSDGGSSKNENGNKSSVVLGAYTDGSNAGSRETMVMYQKHEGLVDINDRQKKVASLYAQYRFIPRYCNLI